ncbi:hypothetical protein C8R45DRAFT_942672 [Mycena sanguinolenta]|nr:hypothetical protein C8R45DRAFT_942672 [Mycena sanguinolenta]
MGHERREGGREAAVCLVRCAAWARGEGERTARARARLGECEGLRARSTRAAARGVRRGTGAAPGAVDVEAGGLGDDVGGTGCGWAPSGVFHSLVYCWMTDPRCISPATSLPPSTITSTSESPSSSPNCHPQSDWTPAAVASSPLHQAANATLRVVLREAGFGTVRRRAARLRRGEAGARGGGDGVGDTGRRERVLGRDGLGPTRRNAHEAGVSSCLLCEHERSSKRVRYGEQERQASRSALRTTRQLRIRVRCSRHRAAARSASIPNASASGAVAELWRCARQVPKRSAGKLDDYCLRPGVLGSGVGLGRRPFILVAPRYTCRSRSSCMILHLAPSFPSGVLTLHLQRVYLLRN